MNKTFDFRRNDFEPYGLSCEEWSPARMPRPDRHNEIELNMLSHGNLTYLMKGKRVIVDATGMAVFWAATPHQIIEYNGNTPYIVATIPLAWFLSWKLPESFVHAIMNGNVLRENSSGRTEADIQQSAQWVIDLKDGSRDNQKTVQLEMEARIRRLAFGSYQDSAVVTTGSSLKGLDEHQMSKIELIAGYIAQHYTEDVSLADIGRVSDLHPNYATGLFRKTFGTTLTSHLTAYRVSHAQRLLVTTDKKILQVALASGFNSLSRFNTAFKKICGSTPHEYRTAFRSPRLSRVT